MIEVAPLDITRMLAVDSTGMAYAPNLYQIQDKDVRELYVRDTTAEKYRYIKEVGVIYYIADPRSPVNQMGYSHAEALIIAKSNYGLAADWKPDALVERLITRYREDTNGVAYVALNTAAKALHNSSLAANFISEQLNIKMQSGLMPEDTLVVIEYINKLNTIINLLPNQMKTLNEAKQSVLLDNEQKKARGGKTITTSMLATDAKDIEAQAEAERTRMGLNKKDVNTPLRGKFQMNYETTK